MRSSAALALVVLSACNLVKAKKDDGASASASASTSAPVASASASAAKPQLPAAPTEPLAFDLDGNKTALPHALAIMSDGRLTIEIANQAQSCDAFESKAGPGEKYMSLELHVRSGPGGTFYAGHPIGSTGDIHASAVPGSYINPRQLVVQIDSADTKPGGHVKGWAIWTRGKNSAKGTFDAKVCPPLAPSAPVELGTDATGNVAGEIGGEKFETKKALAVVKKDKELGGDYVSEIDFFGRDDVTCADTPATDTKNPSLALVDLGGASTNEDFTGSVQPVNAMFAATTWKVGKSRVVGDGWIKLDALDFSAPLKGTFRFATPKGGAGGAFTAEVCRK
jgi:hypothetical protein